MADTIAIFLRFIDRAECLSSTSGKTLEDFKAFIDKARLSVLADLPHDLAALLPFLNALREWLLPTEYELLRIARVGWNEDAFTNLLGWWLSPSMHPATALRRQRAFLNLLNIAEGVHLNDLAIPRLRLYTDDGIPDLVLRFAEFVVVVEAKTGTAEHRTPSGNPQTLSYMNAVRRRFELNDAFPIYMVFLTIDRSSPQNVDAFAVSFLDIAASIVREFPPVTFEDDLRSLLRAWLTHIFVEAPLPGMEIRSLMRTVATSPAPDPIQMLPHLHTITLLKSLSVEVRHAGFQQIQ